MCRGLFRVGPTRNVGQDLATFGDVADMSPTCRRHVELSAGELGPSASPKNKESESSSAERFLFVGASIKARDLMP